MNNFFYIDCPPNILEGEPEENQSPPPFNHQNNDAGRMNQWHGLEGNGVPENRMEAIEGVQGGLPLPAHNPNNDAGRMERVIPWIEDFDMIREETPPLNYSYEEAEDDVMPENQMEDPIDVVNEEEEGDGSMGREVEVRGEEADQGIETVQRKDKPMEGEEELRDEEEVPVGEMVVEQEAEQEMDVKEEVAEEMDVEEEAEQEMEVEEEAEQETVIAEDRNKLEKSIARFSEFKAKATLEVAEAELMKKFYFFSSIFVKNGKKGKVYPFNVFKVAGHILHTFKLFGEFGGRMTPDSYVRLVIATVTCNAGSEGQVTEEDLEAVHKILHNKLGKPIGSIKTALQKMQPVVFGPNDRPKDLAGFFEEFITRPAQKRATAEFLWKLYEKSENGDLRNRVTIWKKNLSTQ